MYITDEITHIHVFTEHIHKKQTTICLYRSWREKV